MKKLTTIIFLLLFSTSVFGAKLYVGGEKYEKDGVIALILTLNGKMIEWVYKENISQCLKSKGQRVEKLDEKELYSLVSLLKHYYKKTNKRNTVLDY